MVAGNVPPSEVAKTLGHEIIGHKGLRAVFGENFDALLDLVYKDHAEEINAYAARYLRDPENNVDDQRYLTEEFLADCADAEVKPSWWKELIAKIRMWLRQRYPKLQFTNRDIEGVISMAARRIRREGARGNMGEYGNVWDGMGEDTVADGATAKENLAVGVDGNTANTGNTATGAAGLRFALDEENDLDITQAFPVNSQKNVSQSLLDLKGKDLKNRETGDKAQINRTQRKKILSQEAIDKSIANGFSKEDHLLATANIEALYENAVLISLDPDIKNNDPNVFIKRYIAPIVFIEKENPIADVLITQKISIDKNTARIYSLEVEEIIPEVSTQGVVRPDPGSQTEGQSLTHRNYPSAVIDKLQVKHKKIKSFLEKNLKKGNFRFSVSPVYTGSAADYDKPSLQFIGSGEGAQIYGWGLYGSESRKVAEWYAEQDVERKTPIYLPVALGIDGVKKEKHEVGQFERDLIDNMIRLQIDEDIDFNFIGATSKDYMDWAIEYNELQMEIHGESKYLDPMSMRYFEYYQRYVKWLKENRDKIEILFQDDSRSWWSQERIVPERNLYKQTFWPGKSENLLDWNKSVPAEQLDLIADALRNAVDNTDLNGIERTDTDKKGGFEYERKKFLTNLGFNKAAGISGGQLYEQMIYIFGSPKAASEFLYRAGIDGVTYIGDSSGVRNYVAFSDKDIRIDEHYRFLLAEFSEADRRDITLILKPFVGFTLDHEDRIYKEYLAKKGIAVSEKDAHAFAVFAMQENKLDRNKRTAQRREKARLENIRRRDQYLYDNFPFYREAVEFAGSHDFKIKPSGKFRGEEFSGSFIAPEFVKYSGEKAAKNSGKLDAAQGVNSDELAAKLARSWGRDALEVEQEIIDFFRELKKRDFYKEYSDFRKNAVLEDKEANRRAAEEFEAQEKFRIENEVIEVLEGKIPITEVWVKENRSVYDELYRQIMKEEPPRQPGKKDIETLNAAVNNETVDAAAFAAAYKAAREAAANEYMAKLRELRDKVMENKADAVQLQKDAWNIARLRLPLEEQAGFVSSILKLMELPTEGNKKYPEGHRMAEFRNIIAKIDMRSRTMRANQAYKEIQELLDSAKTGRTVRGVVYSKLPEVQGDIDQIREIVKLNAPAVAVRIQANNQAITDIADAVDNEERIAELRLQNEALQLFGDLGNADAERMTRALEVLKSVIKQGKEHYKSLLDERLSSVNQLRSRAFTEMTRGSRTIDRQLDNKTRSDYMLKNASLASLMRYAAGVNENNFDSSVSGELFRQVEDSSYEEATRLREFQDTVDAKFREITNTNNATELARIRAKGKFIINGLTARKNTGIYITQYTRKTQIDKNTPEIREKGRRSIAKKFIPVEDYQYMGKPQRGVRSILQAIDNGEDIPTLRGVRLTDMAIHFLRQQLADFDAGIEASYDLFGNDEDNASYDSLLKEERKAAKLMLIAPMENSEAETVELEISPLAALQVLLTWEQADYQDNLRWNGWSDKSIEQLKKFIGDDLVEFGYWMRDKIKENSSRLDAMAFKEYGTHLPDNPNYFPGAFISDRGSRSLENLRRKNSLDTSFLIARKFHLLPVDYSVDALSVFMQNQMQQEHFLAWNDTVKNLKAVYGYRPIRAAINNQVGSNVYSNLMERIATIINGGNASDAAGKLLMQQFRYWVPAKISLNIGSMLKQLAGSVAYANNMPVKEYMRYLVKANSANSDYREFLEYAKNSDYFKNRLAGGMDKDFIFISQMAKNAKDYSPWADAMLRWGTWGTRKMDAISTLKGGFAVYQYTLDQALKSGMERKDAVIAAQRAWMRSTDETQQSGYLKDQNYYQSNAGAYRYLTAFMSNPIQVMNLEWQTINEIRSGNKDAWKKLRRQILVNHFLVPTAMLFVNDLLRRGFDPENWEDFEIEDYFAAWLAGPWEGAFLAGKLGMSALNSIMDIAMGRKFKFHSNTVSAVPVFEEVMSDIQFLAKSMSDDDLSASDLMRIIKSIGSVTMFGGGQFSGIAGGVGALLNAAGTQLRRVFRWFEDDDKPVRNFNPF